MFSYHHIHNIHHLPSSGGFDFSSFLGAFFGAFFAFVFGLIAYRITKKWERFIQHKNALVKLERVLSRHLNQLAILEKLAEDTISVLSQNKMTSNRLFSIDIPEGLDMELGSIDIINKVFSCQSSIDRLNVNVSTFNHSLTRFEDMLIGGQSLLPENIDFAKRMLGGFKADLPQIGQVTRNLLILVRVHISEIKQKQSFIYGVTNSQWDFEISKERLDSENKKFDDEVKQQQNTP